MFSCKDVTELTSEAFDRKLTFAERIQLTIHRMICPPCRTYKRQMNLLKENLDRLPGQSNESMNSDAKERIRERLRQKQQGT